MADMDFLNPPEEPQSLSARDELQIGLAERKRAYVGVFGEHPFSKILLADLRRYCRGDISTFNSDPRIHAFLEGRRDVYQRIIDHIEKSEDQLLTAILRAKKQGEFNA